MRTMESVRADLPDLVTALPGPKAAAIIARDSVVKTAENTPREINSWRFSAVFTAEPWALSR